MNPILQWPGGKRQLLTKLLQHIPLDFSHYCEPFFGAGALFFALRSNGHIGPATIGDLNPDTVALHRAVRDSLDETILKFEALVAPYSKLSDRAARESFYYEIRKGMATPESNPDRAARLLFLNSTGFNGLYRVNLKGGYNVPFGSESRTKWHEKEVRTKVEALREASRGLQNALIHFGSFESFPIPESSGALYYLDPPYAPHDGKKSFTAYTAGGFDEAAQERLAKWAKGLVAAGNTVIASNHDCTLIRSLWSGFTFHEVGVARRINSDAKGRGEVGEVIMVGSGIRAQERANI